ncbi:MAG: sensor histidine kinase [Micromonosporaceae bacterium]
MPPRSTLSTVATRSALSAVAARLGLLCLIVVLTLVTAGQSSEGGLSSAIAWCAVLMLAAVPGLVVPADPVLGRLGRLAEVLIAVMAAATLPGTVGATLPYLVIPVVMAGIHHGTRESVALVGVGMVAVVAAGWYEARLTDPTYLVPAVEWLAIAVALAALGRWLRKTMATTPKPAPYAEATRLLTQLRTVARHLPGGTLDPGGIAMHLLDEVRAAAESDRAAVLSTSGGGRLVMLAQYGSERVDWETSLDADTPVAEAWASQQPQLASRSLSRSRSTAGEVSVLVAPLVAGVRTVGLVAVESDTPGVYDRETVNAMTELGAPAALRLEAALLFDDVRSLATSEERQRLAREIHDGVAQELVMVGYGIDNALAHLPDGDSAGEAGEELRSLRAEVTRVITELRLSLFELRSEVDRHGGLTSAIADYARTVGASAALRVHLSLDESTARLPATVEAELLRIAQEAITNARKHALAENLWVTCEVDPPYARIEVSDDGQGIGLEPPEGRYGLSIMAERADRIRGHLEIRSREPHGTTVAVVLGAEGRHGSVSAPEGVSRDDDHKRPGGNGADQDPAG